MRRSRHGAALGAAPPRISSIGSAAGPRGIAPLVSAVTTVPARRPGVQADLPMIPFNRPQRVGRELAYIAEAIATRATHSGDRVF